MSAMLLVRAKVLDAKVRDQFDSWYQEEHLPEARLAFNAISAWRGWSAIEEDVHLAVYEFQDLKTAQAVAESEAIGKLIAEFDRLWSGRIERTRDIIERLQLLAE